MAERRWAIVGGGILGMTLALRLRQQGQDVTLFEAADHLGGLAAAWRLGDVVWDKHYHVTLLSDLRLRALLEELGLEKEVRWVQTRTGFYTDGHFYSMSNSMEFLRFPPLRLVDKLRLGATIFYASKIRNWRRLEQIPVTAWLRRLSGERTFTKIWLPLLRAKLGENYRHASASFIWAIIARMYAARRSGLKQEMFGYVPGGYARILARFGEHLTAAGVAVRLGHRLRQATPGDGQVCLEFEDGRTETFERAVLTQPSPLAVRACPDLADDERQRHLGIRYQGIVCASLLLKRPLAGYYVTNITDPMPFTAVIEMSALVDRREFGGHHLVYLPKYLDANDPYFGTSDEAVREEFLAGLTTMYPDLKPDEVLQFQVSRVRYVLAIATLNYSDRLPPLATAVPGLYVVNSAHIVNGTLNVNETIQLAERAALMLLADPAPDPLPAPAAV